jgi:hypothetical protein
MLYRSVLGEANPSSVRTASGKAYRELKSAVVAIATIGPIKPRPSNHTPGKLAHKAVPKLFTRERRVLRFGTYAIKQAVQLHGADVLLWEPGALNLPNYIPRP